MKLFLYDGRYLSNLIVIILDKQYVYYDDYMPASVACQAAVQSYNELSLRFTKSISHRNYPRVVCNGALKVRYTEQGFDNVSVAFHSEECGFSFESVYASASPPQDFVPFVMPHRK